MWEFHNPVRPHLSNFLVIFNDKEIPSNREVLFNLSPVINSYLQRYPDKNFYSIKSSEINKDSKISFKNFDTKFLSCLFLGLNFHIREKNRLQLQIISNFLQIEPLNTFLTEINDKIKSFQSTFSESTEIEELSFMEEMIFSLNESNFDYIINFISDNVDHYGHSTICRMLINFYFSRPLKRHLFFDITNQIKTINIEEILKSNSFNDIRINSEITALINYYRKKEIGEEKNVNEKEMNLLHIIQNDDYDNFLELARSIDFDINKEINTNRQSTILSTKCSLIDCSAFYGSEKIFNYLLLNKASCKSSIVKFAVAGGNVKIIHDIELNFPDFTFEKTLNFAIYYHRNELVEWLIETKNVKFDIDNIIEDIFFFTNFKSLIYLIDQISDFEKLLNLAFTNGILLLVKLFSRFDLLIKPFLNDIFSYKWKNNILINCTQNLQNDVVEFLISLCNEDKNIILRTENKNCQNLLHICCSKNNYKLLQYFINQTKTSFNNEEVNEKEQINESQNQQIDEQHLSQENEQTNESQNKQTDEHSILKNKIKKEEEISFISFVNKLDDHENTPLKIACDILASESINILLNLDEVDPNLSDPILDVFSQNSYEHTKMFLENPRFDITKLPVILGYAISSNASIQIIELIMTNPKLTSQIVMNGFYSLLSNLNIFENLDSIKTMLSNIDLTYQDEKGNTFLHRVCKQCRSCHLFDLVQMIVSLNSSCINMINFDKPNGQKPVSLLALNCTNEIYDEVIKSRDFILSHPDLSLNESDVDSVVKLSRIVATPKSNKSNIIDGDSDSDINNRNAGPFKSKNYVESEAESVDSYSDHPLLRDEDIPGVYLYPVNNPNLRNISYQIDNEEEEEEEEEEDNSEDNNNDSDGTSSDSDHPQFLNITPTNIGTVLVVSDSDNDDEKSSNDDDDTDVISLSYDDSNTGDDESENNQSSPIEINDDDINSTESDQNSTESEIIHFDKSASSGYDSENEFY